MEIIDLINKIGMKINANKKEDSHFDCNVSFLESQVFF